MVSKEDAFGGFDEEPPGIPSTPKTKLLKRRPKWLEKVEGSFKNPGWWRSKRLFILLIAGALITGVVWSLAPGAPGRPDLPLVWVVVLFLLGLSLLYYVANEHRDYRSRKAGYRADMLVYDQAAQAAGPKPSADVKRPDPPNKVKHEPFFWPALILGWVLVGWVFVAPVTSYAGQSKQVQVQVLHPEQLCAGGNLNACRNGFNDDIRLTHAALEYLISLPESAQQKEAVDSLKLAIDSQMQKCNSLKLSPPDPCVIPPVVGESPSPTPSSSK